MNPRVYAGPVIIGIIILIFLWLINFFNIAYPVSVTNYTTSGELSVVGEGKVDVVPDSASVQAGIVVSNASTVTDAEKEVNDINNKIVAAMKDLGIDKKDIKTSNYSINPDYNFTTGKNTISGYSGNATLTITVKDQSKLSQVITAATNAGANQIYDTQYTIEDPSKFREEARNKAIADAKEQAKKLADQLGIKLGRIVNIIESSSDGGEPMPLYARDTTGLGGGNVAPDLQQGTQTIHSTVTLFFERR